VDSPVGLVRLTLDQPALLEFVQDTDDPALVRPDGLGERGLGAHRLLDERGEHDVPPHGDVVLAQHRFLARDQPPGQGGEHRGEIAPVVRERAHRAGMIAGLR
jgi:hypothetical protein